MNNVSIAKVWTTPKGVHLYPRINDILVVRSQNAVRELTNHYVLGTDIVSIL